VENKDGGLTVSKPDPMTSPKNKFARSSYYRVKIELSKSESNDSVRVDDIELIKMQFPVSFAMERGRRYAK